MLSGVNNISCNRAFGMAKPKANAVKKIVSDKKNDPMENLHNAMGLMGWVLLIGAMIGGIAYGIIDSLKNKKSEPEKTEIVAKPESVKAEKLTHSINELV